MPPKKVVSKPAKAAANKPPAKAATGKGAPIKKPAAAGKATTSKAAPAKDKQNKTKEPSKPVREWTPKDDAAKKIQTMVRGFLARRKLEQERKRKEEYEQLMDQLEKEAFAKLVRMEQEQAEKDRKKEEEERRRKREAERRKKRILEAAFDGDNDEILSIINEVKELDDKNGVGKDSIGLALRAKHELDIIDCEDANNNTPLSEAAGGGHVDTIKLLIERGANPNSQGHFLRTPLYRAAFAGHMDACQTLLQYGADPRIYASDGQTPGQIASSKALEEMFAEWDIEQTERLLAKLQEAQEQRKEMQKKRHALEMDRLEEEIAVAEADYRTWQKKLCSATQELNKRIYEHDNAANLGFDRPEVTLATIKDAEADLEFVRMECEKARDKLALVRLRLREQMKENAEERGEELPGLKVTMRELDDVLLRDVGNRIKDSGKWPLIIDSSGQASIFLRYRDTNYVDALNPMNMEKEKLRLALLGSLRYGKPLVLDMHEVDMFHQCQIKFDEIMPGLMDDIMDRSVLKDEVFTKLIKETDGPDYNKNNFNDLRLSHFMFIIITKNPFPDDELIERTYPIRIHIPV